MNRNNKNNKISNFTKINNDLNVNTLPITSRGERERHSKFIDFKLNPDISNINAILNLSKFKKGNFIEENKNNNIINSGVNSNITNSHKNGYGCILNMKNNPIKNQKRLGSAKASHKKNNTQTQANINNLINSNTNTNSITGGGLFFKPHIKNSSTSNVTDLDSINNPSVKQKKNLSSFHNKNNDNKNTYNNIINNSIIQKMNEPPNNSNTFMINNYNSHFASNNLLSNNNNSNINKDLIDLNEMTQNPSNKDNFENLIFKNIILSPPNMIINQNSNNHNNKTIDAKKIPSLYDHNFKKRKNMILPNNNRKRNKDHKIQDLIFQIVSQNSSSSSNTSRNNKNYTYISYNDKSCNNSTNHSTNSNNIIKPIFSVKSIKNSCSNRNQNKQIFPYNNTYYGIINRENN